MKLDILVKDLLLLFFVVVVFEKIGRGFWLSGSKLLCLFLIVVLIIGWGLKMFNGRLFE